MLYVGILNTILGVPNECVHKNGIWPCKLSFSCWIQGGRHARGCGNNKWLFSCCVAPMEAVGLPPVISLAETAFGTAYNKKRGNHISSFPKRIFLRRRNDSKRNAHLKVNLVQQIYEKFLIRG